MQSSKFWVEDPCVLFRNSSILPSVDMTREEKLNAVTRLVLIISVSLILIDNKWWYIFLLVTVLIIVLLYYNYNKMGNISTKEGFTMTPNYNSPDFQQTVVSPTYAEEWHVIPPAYDLYTMIPPPETFEQPLKPQSYPYGQYLTKTNLLPADEYYTHMLCGGQKGAREYANSAFLRHDLAFRDNITRIYKKKLNRRFRQNCSDTFSPYSSY